MKIAAIARRLPLFLLCTSAVLGQQSSTTPEPKRTTAQVDLNVWAFYLSGLKLGVLLAEAPVTVNRFFSFTPAIAQIGPPGARATQLRGSVSGSLPFRRFTLENRNLVVHQFNQSNPDVTLYRNRTMLSYLVSRRTPVRLFVFDELFYDWRAQAWNRSWSSGGGSVDLGKHFRVQVYYMRQLQHGKQPANVVVYGVAFRLPHIAHLNTLGHRYRR